MNSKKIAVIGGGFSGLCVVSNIIQKIKSEKSKKNISITLFDPNEIFLGRAFNISLPDTFKLNHEACFMGAINHTDENAGFDDFYNWVKNNKTKPLEILNNKSITDKYCEIDLENPQAYFPRSLYALYLNSRYESIVTDCKKNEYDFTHQKKSVENVTKNTNGFDVICNKNSSYFDIVVLCTGEFFNIKQKNTFSASQPQDYLNNKDIQQSTAIGILGSSLSAVETAVTLAENGYTNITLFSRNGRLPKVRGKVLKYKPKFVTAKLIDSLKTESNGINYKKLIPVLKNEFDFAYKNKSTGLYQKKGINWNEILLNQNALKQLDEDIRCVQEQKELLWRSVISGLHSMEMGFWFGLSNENSKVIVEKYASFILSFFAPMPLIQAVLLQKYLKNDVVKLKKNVTSYSWEQKKWNVIFQQKEKMFFDILIDARGYSLDASKNTLLTTLIEESLIEKHPNYGIKANKEFQIICKNNTHENLYAVGPMLYGERPLKASTIFFAQFAKEVVNDIFRKLSPLDLQSK